MCIVFELFVASTRTSWMELLVSFFYSLTEMEVRVGGGGDIAVAQHLL